MNQLTARQSEVLAAIRAFTKEHNYSPTFRELANVLGIESTNGVTVHLKALERKGYVTREPGKSRTLRLTGETT